MGSLLSAHLIITDPLQPFGNMRPAGYDNELLSMAHDLAVRLLPAFQNAKNGIPFPRVRIVGCFFSNLSTNIIEWVKSSVGPSNKCWLDQDFD